MDDIWSLALQELELQTTRSVFDTWLRHTRQCPNGEERGIITVATANPYAVEWLDGRLRPLIERVLHYVSGENLTLRFILDTSAPRAVRKDESEVELEASATWTPPSFDPGDTKRVAGWFPISEYATRFWAPLLGTTSWRVWEIVRQADRRADKDEWTPLTRYSAPQLAALVPCGKQALIGRNLRCEADDPRAELVEIRPLGKEPERVHVIRQPGAFDRLQAEGIARIERYGERKFVTYRISVRVSLPLLHPAQVGLLPAELQTAHEEWLHTHGLDPELWL